MYPKRLLNFRDNLNAQLKQRVSEQYGHSYFGREIFGRIEKGRKIRSFLFLSSAKSLNDSLNKKKLLDVCLSIEMSHAASVLVDDILDGDDVRHGAQSSHAALGTPASVLQAHFLCAEALLAVSEMPTILNQLLKTYRKLALGEMYDVFLPPLNDNWFSGGYGEFVYQKTSALFEYSLIAAAVVAEREDARESLQKLGHTLGKLYQYSNDYFDMQPHNLKKRHTSNEAWPVTFSLPLALYLKDDESDMAEKLLVNRTLSFDQWMEFLGKIWTPKNQAAARKSLEQCLEEVTRAVDETPMPAKQRQDICALAQLINTEGFWYHPYNAT